MGATSRLRCPICGREASPGPENQARPFCSRQCKLLDLDRWLSGEYRVPGPPVESSSMNIEEGARRDDDLDREGEPKGDEDT